MPRHTVPWLPSLATLHPKQELSGQIIGALAYFVNTTYMLHATSGRAVLLEDIAERMGVSKDFALGLFAMANEMELLQQMPDPSEFN